MQASLYLSLFCLLGLVCADSLPHECGYFVPPAIPHVDDSDLVLKQVSIVFRHGDRIMYQDVQCWPNDTAVYHCQDHHLSTPSFLEDQNVATSGRLFRKKYMENRNYYGGNCETGQLTNKGFEQETATGSMYRKVYVDSGFLPETFDPSITYLRSDEADRCVQSLETLLLGFYPSMATSSEYQIYDINTLDSYYDNITPNSNICPIYSQYFADSVLTPQYLEHYNNVTVPIYEALSEALNMNVDSWSVFNQIHDCSVVHRCHDQLPASITPELYKAIMEEFEYRYYAGYNYPSAQVNAQAGIGYFLEELSGFMLSVVNNTSSPQYKLLLFSGHDTTLVPLINALGQWNGVWAMYASQIQFELYEGTGAFYIRIAYNGENILIPGCSSAMCDWNTFYSFLQTLFPTGNC